MSSGIGLKTEFLINPDHSNSICDIELQKQTLGGIQSINSCAIASVRTSTDKQRLTGEIQRQCFKQHAKRQVGAALDNYRPGSIYSTFDSSDNLLQYCEQEDVGNQNRGESNVFEIQSIVMFTL